MFKSKLLKKAFFILIFLIVIFFSFKLGNYINSTVTGNKVIQINYLNGGDKINNGLYTK